MPLHEVKGRCPACGSTGTLFLGDGGHVTCGLLGCPSPAAPDALLHGEDGIEGIMALVRAVDADVMITHRNDWLVLVGCNGYHGIGLSASLETAASEALLALQRAPDKQDLTYPTEGN